MKKKFFVGLFTLAFGVLALTSCGEKNNGSDTPAEPGLPDNLFKVTYEYPDGKIDEVTYNKGDEVTYNKNIFAKCDEEGMRYYFRGFDTELSTITDTTTVKVLFDKATDLEIDFDTVVKCNNNSKHIIIPDYYTTFIEHDDFRNKWFEREQHKITRVANNAQLGQFESIELGSFVTYVGNNAFRGNEALKEITLKSDCIYGQLCFDGCKNLTKVNLNNCKKLSLKMFNNCTSLRTVENFAPQVIDPDPFSGCTGIDLSKADFSKVTTSGKVFHKTFKAPSKVDLSSCINFNADIFGEYDVGVKEIVLNKDMQFVRLGDGLKSLERINLNELKKVEEISGLNNAKALKNLDLSNCSKLKLIDGFNNTTNLSVLDLSNNKELNTLKGFNNSALKTVKLPKQIGYIDGLSDCNIVNHNFDELTNLYEINGCKGIVLENLDLRSYPKLREISKDAFVIKNKLTLQKDIENKPINAKIIEIKEGNYVYNLPKVEQVIFAPDADKIGISLFENNTNITSIIIPKGITLIGMDAFANCSNLKKVDFEDGSLLSDINGGAFLNCHNLAYIETQKCPYLDFIGTDALVGTRLKRLFLMNKNLKCYSEYPKTLAIIYADSMKNIYQENLNTSLKFLLVDTAFDGYAWIEESIFRTKFNELYEEDGFLYHFSDYFMTASLISYYGDNRTCVIKDEITINNKKYPVTSIGRFAFKTNHVSYLKISDTVEDVGDLFYNTSNPANIRLLELGKKCKPNTYEIEENSYPYQNITTVSAYNCPAIGYYKDINKFRKEGFYLDVINKKEHRDIDLVHIVDERFLPDNSVKRYNRCQISIADFEPCPYTIKDNFIFIDSGETCVAYIGEFKDHLKFPNTGINYTINFKLDDGCTCNTYSK